ncbi:MAG TPA: four-carbon acid sugar kinase family protein [Verrucomicrobiae bacterium]|nr:four-carbon acid sugar kinase family protein [Verrucomicrobiae bacterium]
MIGVIADDLTGAAELSGVGLRYGLRAEVVAAGSESRLPAAPRDGPAEAGTPNAVDLICVDTDSRACLPAEAGRRAAEAANRLTALRTEWIYKKVDSVLRGHIVVELDAMMNQLDLKRAVLVPANPSLERVVRNGQYFVRGKPIHETDFRLDPEFPRYTSSVDELLGASGARPVNVCGTDDPLPLSGIIIGEAETTDDLRHWASRTSGATLLAGAAEFFAMLLEARGHRVAPSVGHRSAVPVATPELFVCGSTSEACRNFLVESRRRGVPVFGLPEELARGAEFTAEKREPLAARVAETIGTSPRVILEVGLQPVSDPRLSRQLANQLVELVRAVLLRAQAKHVFAEGGATGASLMRGMDWTRLRVVREIAPGVVTFQVVGDRRYLLTLKPGSYLWPKDVGP